ncbi:MAG: hypothetical protein GX092_07460 [Clostridia bacterium]|jgi:hypothetical protein|nr:hypothetical protein [Clostridia bacterium]
MKALMRIFSLGVVLASFFSLNICTYATETEEITNISTGLLEIKANVPSDFSYPLLIQLIHESKTKSFLSLPSNDGYQLTEELPSGEYVVLIGGGYDENGSYGLPPDYVIKHPTVLVVVGNRTNTLEFSVNLKSDVEEANNPESISEQVTSEQNEEETGQKTEDAQQNASEVKQAKEPIEEVGKVQTADESLENAEEKQKRNYSKEFIKKNFFSLLLLIVLCIVIIYIKVKNEI